MELPRVVVEMGPSKARHAVLGRRRQQRRRALRFAGLGAAVVLCLLQLLTQATLISEGDGQARALVRVDTATAAPAAAAVTAAAGIIAAAAASPPPPGSSADLDALYPAEAAFWEGSGSSASSSASGSPPWIERMRADWLTQGARERSVAATSSSDLFISGGGSQGGDLSAGSALPVVTRKLHQTWKDANPPRALFSPRWSETLRGSNPEWEYRLWTDAENHQLIAEHYPWFLGTYDAYPSAIQRADAARYFLAHRHGGLYADLDIECFRPLAPLAENASLVLSYKQGSNFSKGASNAIFLSAKAHPFWGIVFDVLRNRSHTRPRDHKAVLYSTGPAVLREAVRRLLRLPAGVTISARMLGLLRIRLGIVILDSSYLYPVTADRRANDELESLPPQAHCRHHFVSSWVTHNKTLHKQTELLRNAGHKHAAMEGTGQQVMQTNTW